MDYNHIKGFLDKFRIILSTKEDNYKIISEIIEKNCNVVIETKNIKVSGTNIYIKSSPIMRNEILMRKEKILNDLKDLKLSSNYKDIK